MKTLQFKKTVEPDGSVFLCNLPPNIEVEINVVPISSSWPKDFDAWANKIKSNHLFSKKSKKAILADLRNSRERLANERHKNSN